MSNNIDGKDGNVYERLWKLLAMIGKMILDGVRDPEKVADILQTIVDGAGSITVYLKRLFEVEIITIDATDGTETLVSSGVFPGDVVVGKGAFNTVGKPTLATSVAVFVLERDGKYSDIFESLGVAGQHEYEQSQIAQLFRVHGSRLMENGAVCWIRLKGGLVAFAGVDGHGRLWADIDVFSKNIVWHPKKYKYLVIAPVSVVQEVAENGGA